MATKSTYQIVVDTQYNGKGAKEAKRGIEKLSDSVEDGNKRLKKQQDAWKDFGFQAAAAGAVLVGAGIAAKKAYEFIGQGAQLSAAAGKFDNLAVSIGTVGDGLLGKMRTATKGMISDANLIASGTDIMSLGLANTEDGVVRMASAVGALNLDMQVLALTLANDSTMRLDNLGLSLEAVTKRKKELIASGFIGDAFDEAVLRELEVKMTLLGDASETTAGKMAIFEASVSNVKDGLATMIVESDAVQTTVTSLSKTLDGFNRLQEAKTAARDDLTEAVRRGIITEDEAYIILRQSIRGHDEYVDKLRETRDELERQDEASAGLSSTAAEVNAIMEEKARILAGLEEAERRETAAIYAAIEASDGYIAATAELDDKLRIQAAALSPLELAQRAAERATRDHAIAAGLLIEEAEKAPSVMEQYANALDGSERAANTGAGGQENYRQSMQDLAENVDVAADRTANLTMKILGIPPSVSSKVSVDFGDAFSQIGRLTTALGSMGAARAIDGDGDDVFAGDSSTGAGLPGGNQGQTSSGGFATGGNNAGASRRVGDTDFDPLARGANGLNMIVPAGFPNDSFPIAAQSGERVTIETPQQQQNGGRGNVTININGGDVAQIRRVLREEGISADSRRRMG